MSFLLFFLFAYFQGLLLLVSGRVRHKSLETYAFSSNIHTADGRNPANQLRLVVYPSVYGVLYIPGGFYRISSINSMFIDQESVDKTSFHFFNLQKAPAWLLFSVTQHTEAHQSSPKQKFWWEARGLTQLKTCRRLQTSDLWEPTSHYSTWQNELKSKYMWKLQDLSWNEVHPI